MKWAVRESFLTSSSEARCSRMVVKISRALAQKCRDASGFSGWRANSAPRQRLSRSADSAASSPSMVVSRSRARSSAPEPCCCSARRGSSLRRCSRSHARRDQADRPHTRSCPALQLSGPATRTSGGAFRLTRGRIRIVSLLWVATEGARWACLRALAVSADTSVVRSNLAVVLVDRVVHLAVAVANGPVVTIDRLPLPVLQLLHLTSKL